MVMLMLSSCNAKCYIEYSMQHYARAAYSGADCRSFDKIGRSGEFTECWKLHN